jgi:ABC-2 type transport system ATP-binding protein
MIEVKDLTLTYPSGKGVFNLNFSIQQGEVMGYLGPNGAGKTTTIRALMGFMRPNNGSCAIGGLDCIRKAPEIQKTLGYIPGEISFLNSMDGDEFLKFMCRMRGTRTTKLQKDLLGMFELDPKGKIRKFSKGMKQKLGIVTAFMHDPDILVLDEPTSGLDPLMQNRFVELILNKKKEGKTILMSSHSFEEVERTCNNVLIIKEGRIIKQSDVQTLKNTQRRGYIIKTDSIPAAAQMMESAGFEVMSIGKDTMEVYVTGGHTDRLIKTAAKFNVLDIDVKSQSLEDVFMQFYAKEDINHV